MPRTARYAIGARIESHFLDLLELIYQAYYAGVDRKTEYIIASISKTDMLRYLLQIAWENKQVKENQYIALSQKLQEVGKILGGWKNNALAKQNPSKK